MSERQARLNAGAKEPANGTSQRLLAAAWRLLLTGGAEAVTLRAVANEAGERMSSITYHFGSKQGLFAALVDYVVHDFMVALVDQTAELPAGDDRLDSFVTGVSRIAVDHDAAIAWLDVLPLILRDDPKREKVATVYEWYRASFLRCMGVDGGAVDEDQDALAVLMVAVMDGLAIQYLIEPTRINLEKVTAVWRSVLSAIIYGQLQSASGAMPTETESSL